MGLGLGANQRIIVIVAFAIMAALIWLRYFLTRKSQKQNMYFTVSSPAVKGKELELRVH